MSATMGRKHWHDKYLPTFMMEAVINFRRIRSDTTDVMEDLGQITERCGVGKSPTVAGTHWKSQPSSSLSSVRLLPCSVLQGLTRADALVNRVSGFYISFFFSFFFWPRSFLFCIVWVFLN